MLVFFLETIFLYAQRNIFDHDLKIDRFGIDAKGELVVLDPGVTEPLADAVIAGRVQTGEYQIGTTLPKLRSAQPPVTMIGRVTLQ